jgi:hypothetical protein
MADYVMRRDVFDGRHHYRQGTVASVDADIGDRWVVNGWADKKTGRPRSEDTHADKAASDKPSGKKH